MSKLLWSIKELPLPLKFVWKISRNASDFKTNFIIEVTDPKNKVLGLGEIAFNIRYGESKEQIINQFQRFQNDCPDQITRESLDKFLTREDFSPALSFGIESAYTRYLANLKSINIFQILNLKEGTVNQKIKTSFSIPILELNQLESFYREHKLARFHSLKIKIGCPKDIISINKLLSISSVPIRIDANEAFNLADDVLLFLKQINDLSRVEFLEQPFSSENINEQILLKKNCPVLLAADESVVRDQIPENFPKMFDIVNVKLMKAGSFQNAISQLRQIKKLGLKTMLGCMVETSLGISSALYLAQLVDIFDLDGFLFLKDEPFGLVDENEGILQLKN